jgi:hypothetical protein
MKLGSLLLTRVALAETLPLSVLLVGTCPQISDGAKAATENWESSPSATDGEEKPIAFSSLQHHLPTEKQAAENHPRTSDDENNAEGLSVRETAAKTSAEEATHAEAESDDVLSKQYLKSSSSPSPKFEK